MTTQKVQPAKRGAEPAPIRKRRHRGWLSALLCVGLGAAGLALGRMGHLWPRFDVFAHFTIQAAALLAAGLLGLLVPRFKGLAAVGLFIAAVAAYGAWPLWRSAAPFPEAPPGMKRLVVAELNRDATGPSAAAVKAAISGLGADIVMLTDLTKADGTWLNEIKQEWPHQSLCIDDIACDVAIISKVPLVQVGSSSDQAQASFVMARLPAEYGDALVLSVHASRFPETEQQRGELRDLVQRLEHETGPVIIAGDFNATPYSRVLTDFSKSLGANVVTDLPTWPTRLGMPQLAIDHVLVAKGAISLGSERLGQAMGSDHFPIIQAVAVPAN